MWPVLSALLPVRKFWPSDDEGGAVAPVLGEGMAELCVDQIGQRRPVGFVADVPGLAAKPAWRRSCRGKTPPSWSGPVDRVGEDRGQQQVLVFGRVARFQMREMPSEARPFVHLQQQFGDLDVRQDHCRLVDQRLGGVGYRRVERRDLQA